MKGNDQRETFTLSLLRAKIRTSKKPVYAKIPQTATGIEKRIDQGLCATVSQLIAPEIAQKLLYSKSV